MLKDVRQSQKSIKSRKKRLNVPLGKSGSEKYLQNDGGKIIFQKIWKTKDDTVSGYSPQSLRPTKEIKTDMMSHWQVLVENRGTCKFPGCIWVHTEVINVKSVKFFFILQ